MISFRNKLGRVRISHRYFADLVAHIATGCFGVTRMMPAGTNQRLRGLAHLKTPDRGVRVRTVNGKLFIELHIAVAMGVNIKAVVKSIASEVRYAVESRTGLGVGQVFVYVDALGSANAQPRGCGV